MPYCPACGPLPGEGPGIGYCPIHRLTRPKTSQATLERLREQITREGRKRDWVGNPLTVPNRIARDLRDED